MKEKEEKWTVYNSFPCLDIWIGKSVTKDRKNDQMHCYFLHTDCILPRIFCSSSSPYLIHIVLSPDFYCFPLLFVSFWG
nr:hypothetical protein Q903MT_gene1239 [Picea sitchensis]